MNVRYDIGPEAVAGEIARAVEQLIEFGEELKARVKAPSGPYGAEGFRIAPKEPVRSDEHIDRDTEKAISEQENYYATVRVIKRPIEDEPFILVYGDEDDAVVQSGTGGFATFEKAQDWFLKGGR